MTFALLTPEEQQAIWFLGSLVHIRLGGGHTDGQLAVVHHEGERGFGSPRHRHLLADETFLVLEGELSVELDGDFQSAGPGSAVFLPRQRSHAFVITSPVARYVTLHTPADFDALLLASGSVAVPGVDAPPTEASDLAELARIAREHSIEILGPPPSLEEALGPRPRT